MTMVPARNKLAGLDPGEMRGCQQGQGCVVSKGEGCAKFSSGKDRRGCEMRGCQQGWGHVVGKGEGCDRCSSGEGRKGHVCKGQGSKDKAGRG